jgi:hypothetical protein
MSSLMRCILLYYIYHILTVRVLPGLDNTCLVYRLRHTWQQLHLIK